MGNDACPGKGAGPERVGVSYPSPVARNAFGHKTGGACLSRKTKVYDRKLECDPQPKANQNFAKFCARKFEFSGAFSSKKMRRLEPTYGLLIAENHDLAGILDRAKPASLKLFGKLLSTDVAIHISKAAPYNMAVARSLRGEDISDPFFRIDRAMIIQHGPILVFLG